MTDYKPTPLSRITPTLWGIKFEEIIYLALIGLSLIGVAITNYAPTQSSVYWFIMIAAFASASIALEHLQAPAKGLPFRKVLTAQLIHWGARLVAVLISFTMVKTGQVTYEGAGLVILLILSLATFLNGIHIGWRFYLAGLLLGLTTVAAAYFEQFMWIIFMVIIASIFFTFYLENYLAAKKPEEPR